MAKERTSVRMQEQIRELSKQGASIHKIAQSLKVSRKTVRKFLRIQAPGSEAGSASSVSESPSEFARRVNWEAVRDELSRGCTIKQLHLELASEVSLSTFWRVLKEKIPSTPQVTLRLQHKPGEKVQIDFCDGIDLVDPQTGQKVSTQLFVGTLPFSSYVYGEFVFNQKLSTFMGAHERMFAYFGGVTPYAVPDNLKSGVRLAHWYDPDLNGSYCEFATHYGFAVLPARPYRPQDKGATEASVGVIQRGFYPEVRDRTFYSLTELNIAFREYLERLNQQVMKDYGLSRKERFEEERKLLKALPSSRYQISEWKSAKVHPDCHIQVEKNFYSVPYRFVGQTVQVRLTEKLLEIFNEDHEPIVSHIRLKGSHQFSTEESHYPQEKLALSRYEVAQAKRESEKIGKPTKDLVEDLLSGTHSLRHLRRVQGILRLAKKISAEALNYACSQALTFQKKRLSYIESCALHFHRRGPLKPSHPPHRDLEESHLHQAGGAA